MENLISTFLFSVLAILASGCNEVDEPYVITCEDGLVEWENGPFFQFNLRNVGDDRTKELNLIINNDAEYEHYISPLREYPKIDFKRKSLLIVRIFNNYGYSLTERRLTIDCKKKELHWISNASIYDTGYGMVEPQLFMVLVPKLHDNTILIFDTNIVK